MRDCLKKAGEFWKNLLFDDRAKFSLWRVVWAAVLSVLLVTDPFCAAGLFRYFLFFLLAGAVVLLLGNIRNRNGAILALVLAAVFFFCIWSGRGDSVSGYGVIALLFVAGAGLIKPAPRSTYPRYNGIWRVVCAAAALFMAAVMIFNGRKLGVSYLDHLGFYALGCAGCALAWLSQIRKSKI